MNKIKKIIAPTDLSRLSLRGLQYAIGLADTFGAEVIVYYAVSYDEVAAWTEMNERQRVSPIRSSPAEILRKSQMKLADIMSANFPDGVGAAKVRELAEFGNPEKGIVALAKTEHADLIVMSTYGRTGFSHIVLGSVTEKVVRHAPCLVLAVPAMVGQKETKKAAATRKLLTKTSSEIRRIKKGMEVTHDA